MTEQLPDAVRSRRRELGLGQRDLADLAGVSERFVRAVEAGKETVQLDRLRALLDALGLELRIRLRGDDGDGAPR